MNCVVYILAVVLRSTILYLEYILGARMNKFHVQSVKIVIFRVSRLFAIVNRA